MTALPQHAARAAQETREQGLREAQRAYLHDLNHANRAMAGIGGALTHKHLDECEAALTACHAHIAEMRRHIPGSARQGQVRDVAEGDPAYLEEQGR